MVGDRTPGRFTTADARQESHGRGRKAEDSKRTGSATGNQSEGKREGESLSKRMNE